ncbi:MAG: bis-aminopropyl spermidine synthase family protein [Candidatus Thorarchaeota archaeon]
MFLLPFEVKAEMVFQVGDNFTVQFSNSLTGRSGDYEDYSEEEYDTRVYNVTAVSEMRVDFEMSREYSYSDSEGGYYSESTSHTFAISPENRSYLDDTFDAPADYSSYYNFDTFWFRIDPSLSEGDTVHILGYDYTVNGLTTVFIDAVTAVDVIEVQSLNIVQTVDDPEYDPDGTIQLYIDDTYYFDPNTGYFVMETWDVDVSTSVGSYSWYEVGVVLNSSYALQYNQLEIVVRWSFFAALVMLVGLCVVCANRAVKASQRSEVDAAIKIMRGQKKPPIARGKRIAPNLWKPLELDYHSLIDDAPPSDLVTLQPGVFIVVDPGNKLAIVDTITNPRFKNLLFDFDLSSLQLLYKLVLGTIAENTVAHQEVMTRIKDVKEYIHPVTAIAAPDPHSYNTFNRLESTQDPEYDEISYLMARRRVLDYSLGQAPLTPRSHIMKLNHILRHEPGNVLLVGDDDLLSISLARRGISVTVLEIDPYTCALLSTIAKEENLSIRIQQVDLRSSLPILQEEFDLFVADPDFAIEAFALFLSRGLSLLRIGGIGLINFQDTKSQRYKAKYLLEKLGVEILEESKEKWHYTIVVNEKASGYYGKYTVVNYSLDVKLNVAPYSSVMYTIRKNELTDVVLEAHENLKGAEQIIYDF